MTALPMEKGRARRMITHYFLQRKRKRKEKKERETETDYFGEIIENPSFFCPRQNDRSFRTLFIGWMRALNDIAHAITAANDE
jgi:hypothetical protein